MDKPLPSVLWRAAQLAMVVLCLVARPALAQDSGDEDAASGEVIATCPWFGVGGLVRPGEWAGLRLSIKDSSDKPREVLVRIAMPDPDGDRVLYEGRITTNPGVPLPLWVYLYLPGQYRQTDVLTVNCFAAVEEGKGGPEAGSGGFGAGRLLGSSRIKPRMVHSRSDGLMAVVGARRMGLDKYRGYSDGSNQSIPLPTGHERTYFADALTPDTLPDRWYGLRQFDAIVWNDAPPSGLGTDKAQAIREWVQRGGHLIVVLPRVAQAWTDEANNPLHDITPRVIVDRHEGTDLTPYRRLITKARLVNEDGTPGLKMPTSEVLQTFRPLDNVQPGEAVGILSAVDGEPGKNWIVVRRQVGIGMVDLVGLDVASTWMNAHGLPDADLFWHRVLGRRGVLLTPAELNAGGRMLSNWRDSPVTVDRDVGGAIGMSGSAGVGVLMGLVVFAAYWVIAGPLGFAVLKKTGQARHAWVAFVAAAGVFTALAWGGASAVRPAQLRAQHLSILDHAYSATLGGSVERARSWVSLLVPEYGEATVSVGDPATKATSSFHNTIAPWEAEGAQSAGFPDARGYRVDSKSPDQYTIPTRSTVKQFMVDWAGGSKLKTIRPLPIDGADGPRELRLSQENNKDIVRGTLVHDLPAPLEDVQIILVKGQSDVSSAWWVNKLTPPVLSHAVALSLDKPWGPGEPIDLFIQPFTPSGAAADKVSRIDEFMKKQGNSFGRGDQGEAMASEGGGNAWSRLLGATFFPLLDPPDIADEDTVRVTAQKLYQRHTTHGLDLAAYFTQPCIIVVGRLDKKTESACPAPLYVDTGGGFREVKTEGSTIIRWVYPLPANPPAILPVTEDPPVTNERKRSSEETPSAPNSSPRPRRRN